MSKYIVEERKTDSLGLAIDEKINYLMLITPLNPKGQPKDLKRFIRIKRNLIREMRAFNKEARRHYVR